jgi:hypothetical protein
MNKEHIDFITIREDFNVYEIENGQILKVKQILTDVVVETIEDNKKISNLGLKEFSTLITNIEIDTSKLEYATPDQITEADEVKELQFRSIRELVNIYETNKSLILLVPKLQKVFLTNKKDHANAPILRYKIITSFNLIDKDSLVIRKPELSYVTSSTSKAYSNSNLLEDHSNRFLCRLYFLANGILERSFNAVEVFNQLHFEAFTDKEQPTAEIVQHLERLGHIEVRGYREVKLTTAGLDWCKSECYRPLYSYLKD